MPHRSLPAKAREPLLVNVPVGEIVGGDVRENRVGLGSMSEPAVDKCEDRRVNQRRGELIDAVSHLDIEPLEAVELTAKHEVLEPARREHAPAQGALTNSPARSINSSASAKRPSDSANTVCVERAIHS